MRFLDKLALKQYVDNKLMTNAINFSILDHPYNFDYNEMENGVSKSKVLEPTIKNLIKETPKFGKEGKKYKIRDIPNGKITLKSTRGCSRYNTITKWFIEEIVEWIWSNPSINPPCVSSDAITVLNTESNQK